MAPSWQMVIALVVGGIAFLSVGGFCLILWIARWRHKRALVRLSAASDRRLSRYPSGHITFTDDDFATIPRTKKKLRRPVRVPFEGAQAYANLSSDERIQHPPAARVSSAPAYRGISQYGESQQLSWPLPRRLTRSNSIPLIRMPPITEAPKFEKRASRVAETVRSPGAVVGKVEATTNGNQEDTGKSKQLRANPMELIPSALFSEKPRSISFSHMVPTHGGFRAQHEEKAMVTGGKGQERSIAMPRSVSLCNQQPGEAPTQPIPPLPLEIARARSQRESISLSNLNGRRASIHSLLSGVTSVIDTHVSHALSRPETDPTSISLRTTSGVSPTPAALRVKPSTSFIWQAPGMNRAPSPLQVAKSPQIRPKFEHQRSFRASLQNTLPSSGSSGLSISLVDQALSTATSVATLNPNGSPACSKSRLRAPKEIKPSRLSFPPRSPLRRNPTRVVSDEINPKRSSASALQVISGNECNPMHSPLSARPSSIATKNPFEWDARMLIKPGKPSTKRDRKIGHKRQNCVRISKLPPANPSPIAFGAMPKEPKRGSHDNAQPPRFSIPPIQDQLNWPIRPPSRVTFNPQLPPTTPTPASRRSSRPGNARASVFTPVSTPSFALGNLTVDENESPLSLPKTRAGANPNRHRKIPSGLGNDEALTLFTSQRAASKGPKIPSSSEQTSIAAAIELQDNTFGFPPPSTRLFPFPSPPHPVRAPSPTEPTGSPIRSPRGPRALPRSPTRCDPQHRNSSVRTFKPSLSSNCISDPRQSELCKSIATLRRMNSEVGACSQLSERSNRESTSSKRTSMLVPHVETESPKDPKKGHERYLSLGSSHARSLRKRDSEEGLSPLAKTIQDEVRKFKHGHSNSCEIIEGLLIGRGDRQVKGPRDMPTSEHLLLTPTKGEDRACKESPGSLYDKLGFLST